MGIPASADVVRGLLDTDHVGFVESEPSRPFAWTPGADVSVGHLVAERFGEQVVARSVDPMLGGVYSARSRDLGLREAIPALAAELDIGAPSLTAAVAAVIARGTGTGPVFGALRGGYRTLVDALILAARGDVTTNVAVPRVVRVGERYRLDGVGDYNAVVVATPVWTAGELLADVAPVSAAAFAGVRAAGSAVVGFAVDAESPLPENSGVLVASDADLSIKAITLSSRKWPHLAPQPGGVSVLRASFGRLGEPVTGSDSDLVERATADLQTVFGATGLPAPTVVDAAVQRWPGVCPITARVTSRRWRTPSRHCRVVWRLLGLGTEESECPPASALVVPRRPVWSITCAPTADVAVARWVHESLGLCRDQLHHPIPDVLGVHRPRRGTPHRSHGSGR